MQLFAVHPDATSGDAVQQPKWEVKALCWMSLGWLKWQHSLAIELFAGDPGATAERATRLLANPSLCLEELLSDRYRLPK
jgi:hypothetical protein